MNRRDLLKAGLVGIGAALAGDAEAAPGEDVPGAIARLRRRLDRTRELDLAFLRAPGAARPADRARAEIDETLIRSSMRALLVTGGVMDLGEEARAHPEVQRLVAEVAPEADHAVEGALLRLQTLPRADRRRVQAELKRNPAIAEDVARELEHLAGKGGASLQRRFHLRTLLQQATWRLTHQPLDSVLAEAVEKTHAQAALVRDAPPPAREGPWAEATARIGSTFGAEDAASTAHDARAKPPRDEDSVEVADWDDAPVLPSSRVQRLQRRAGIQAAWGGGLAVTGFVLLGIGVASSNAVLTIGSLFVLTAAVVMLIIALVTLIMAAAAASREADARDAREALLAEREPDDEPRPAAERAPEAGEGTSDSAAEATPYLADGLLTQNGGWMRAGVQLEIAGTYQVRAWGVAPSWGAPQGDPAVAAGPDAPVPGSPLGAVVGRVGEMVWVVGRDFEISGVWGDLELAVNAPAAADAASFRVTVRRLK